MRKVKEETLTRGKGGILRYKTGTVIQHLSGTKYVVDKNGSWVKIK